ncbi:MAG: branched-chain amino acid ABC transporter permease [Candidatus Bathyarchaeia archaeon]
MIAKVIELVLWGIMFGSVYTIAGIGISFIRGVLGVLDLSYGSKLTLAAFLAFTLSAIIGVNPALVILIVLLLVAAISSIMARYLVYPFRVNEMRLLLITFSLGVIFEQLIYLIFGPNYIINRLFYIPGTLIFWGMKFPYQNLVIFLFSTIILLVFWVFLLKSKWGKAIRAVSQDEEAARLMGIDTKRVYIGVFVLSGILVAMAGIFLSSIYMFHTASGAEYLFVALSIIVVGGLGDLRGAVFSGFLLATIEMLVGYYVSSRWRLPIFFIAVVLTLVLRPKGIFRSARGG